MMTEDDVVMQVANMVDELRDARRDLAAVGARINVAAAENTRLRTALAAIGAAVSGDAHLISARVSAMVTAALGDETDWRTAYELRHVSEQRDAAREEAARLRARLERAQAAKNAASLLLMSLHGAAKVTPEADALRDALTELFTF